MRGISNFGENLSFPFVLLMFQKISQIGIILIFSLFHIILIRDKSVILSKKIYDAMLIICRVDLGLLTLEF